MLWTRRYLTRATLLDTTHSCQCQRDIKSNKRIDVRTCQWSHPCRYQPTKHPDAATTPSASSPLTSPLSSQISAPWQSLLSFLPLVTNEANERSTSRVLIPPMTHARPSSRNAASIGSGMAEHPRLPSLSGSNVDRDREREHEQDRDIERDRERERMMTPFVIRPSQATQAHFSTTPDTVPRVVREVREVRERRVPESGFLPPEEPIFRHHSRLLPWFLAVLQVPLRTRRTRNLGSSIPFRYITILLDSQL